MDEVWRKVADIFKIKGLKDYQKEVFKNLLKGKDCFVGQPTGSGKSLLFQAWPFLKSLADVDDRDRNTTVNNQIKDLVIIVAPITSLIENQISILKDLGIKACCLEASSTKDKNKAFHHELFNIIFTSPETILERNRDILKNKSFTQRVIGVAVDESHCIKKWGESDGDSDVFRKWYGKLSEIRSFLPPKTPMLAVTATATSTVRQEIIDNLELYQPFISVAVPSKPNVKYFLYDSPTKNVEQIFAPYVTDIANNGFEATRVIVFCRTSHNLRKLFSLFDGKFSSYYPDPLSRPYARFHSRTQIEVKSMINKSLSDPNGKVRFLMATIAFGMGIDCKGLHTVIHFGTPSDMDDYFQESGRVGRDGAPSRAILLTYPHCLVSPKISKEMKAYAKNSEVCRRKVLMAQYSTDSFQSFQPLHLCCDVCEKQCDCNQEDCKSIDLHEFGLTDQTEPVVECSLNSDGIKYLKLKLTKLRESLIADHEGVVSPSISSGFSLECITQIVNIASCSLTEEDIYVKTALMNKSVITQIHELVRQVVTEPLFEKKDFDDEYYFSDESNDDSDPENSSRYRFSNDSSGESDCE